MCSGASFSWNIIIPRGWDNFGVTISGTKLGRQKSNQGKALLVLVNHHSTWYRNAFLLSKYTVLVCPSSCISATLEWNERHFLFCTDTLFSDCRARNDSSRDPPRHRPEMADLLISKDIEATLGFYLNCNFRMKVFVLAWTEGVINEHRTK